jgi:hypothetical protein
MAIIRKNDKKAEQGLKNRANSQTIKRWSASDSSKQKAGLSFVNKNKTSITSNPSRIQVFKDATGKTSATYKDQPFQGPVSGSAISLEKEHSKRFTSRNASGVIRAGKVVKSGAGPVASAMAAAQKKKNNNG